MILDELGSLTLDELDFPRFRTNCIPPELKLRLILDEFGSLEVGSPPILDELGFPRFWMNLIPLQFWMNLVLLDSGRTPVSPSILDEPDYARTWFCSILDELQFPLRFQMNLFPVDPG